MLTVLAVSVVALVVVGLAIAGQLNRIVDLLAEQNKAYGVTDVVLGLDEK